MIKDVRTMEAHFNWVYLMRAPKNPGADDKVMDGCRLSVAALTRYELVVDAITGRIHRSFGISNLPLLQTLRTIGVSEYDHPVQLAVRFQLDPEYVDPDALVAALEPAKFRFHEVILPRWTNPTLQQIGDPERDNGHLKRLLSDPNDLVLEFRESG